MDCPVPIEEDGRWVYKTAREIIRPSSWQYLKAFNFYEKSILPNGNGWMNESNKYIESMLLIDNEFGRIKNEEERKSKNG